VRGNRPAAGSGGERRAGTPAASRRFAPGVSSPIAYEDYAVGGHLVDDQSVLRELSGVYDQLQAQALDERKSLDMIVELIER
jgi:hypothetical protein